MPRRDDDFGRTYQPSLPPLTPVIRVCLITLAAFFVVQMLDEGWLGTHGILGRSLALVPGAVLHGQVWRLLTYVLVQSNDPFGLAWGCVPLYFFGGALEDWLGTRRFLWFLLTTVILTGLLATLYGLAHRTFLALPLFGVAPLGWALTAAWGTRFPNQRLLFPPVSGRVLVYVSLGLAALVILAQGLRENPAASIGAILVGWTLARSWDRVDDLLDRLRVRSRSRRHRDSRLRAIPGGKSARPSDKRFLN